MVEATSTASVPAKTAAGNGGIGLPWQVPWQDVVQRHGVSVAEGLTEAEAAARLARFGPNQLRRHKRWSGWSILRAQFESLIVLLLAVAAVVAFLFGEVLEGGAIVAVIVLNAAIGFVTEWRAVRSMEALFRLSHVPAHVRRDGHVRKVPAEVLVPGDVVELEIENIGTLRNRVVKS